MNKSFATYTPRPRPMDYDAIAGREGCEPDSGNDYQGLKAFSQLCVHAHDPESEIFKQPPTVSYSIGPYVKGNPAQPFMTSWAVWVGSIGVRVGKALHIDPPADDIGENSSLYLKTKPAELTHAWNAKGDLAIAIQKDPLHIELKQYIDDAGNHATYSWHGISPALYYTGHVIKGDTANLDQLVCYYLHALPEKPNVLYARFESEGWAIEHVVMPSMRVGLKQLINVVTEDGKVILYALDERGRDVVLTSPVHETQFIDLSSLDVALLGGGVSSGAAIDVEIEVADKGKVDIKLNNGRVLTPLVDTGLTPTSEDTSLKLELIGGDVLS